MRTLQQIQQRAREFNPTFLDLDELGLRWHCHRMTAYRRMKRLGVKPMKLSTRQVLFRLSDIARVENECV
jgi:hypothetical protein